MHRAIVLVILLASVWFVPRVHAAQSYDNCAGFIDSVPATISKQGVWCLRKDVSTANTSGNAITFNASNFTIDCNDFKVGGLAAGNGSQATGIYANDRQNVSIRHCGIRGFFSGIRIQDGAGALVEDNRLDNNLAYGMYVTGENGRIRRNAVYDTGGATGSSTSTAIYATADIFENDVSGVFTSATPSYPEGIESYGAAVRDNRIANLIVNGGGYAVGIYGTTNGVSVVGNQIYSGRTSVAGYGIYFVRFCVNNTVSGFATAYSCATSLGNVP